MTTVIGLSGYARSGKDTVADYLCTTHGFTKMSFADPMREALYRVNPLITVGEELWELQGAVDWFGWEVLKGDSPQVRPLLQRFGTEFGRDMLGENVWVDLALSQIEEGAKVVFADVRFPNEADAVVNAGGPVWRITRGDTKPANAHVSEQAMDDYSFTDHIANEGSLQELYGHIEHLIYGGKADKL